jgi:hypothetical protein
LVMSTLEARTADFSFAGLEMVARWSTGKQA